MGELEPKREPDMQTAKMDELIDRVEQLHAAPHVASRVLELIREPNFEISEVVICLEQDPALAATMLRLVNSTYFGLSRKIGSLHEAITYIGRRSLRLAVLSYGLFDRLVQGAPEAWYYDFWRRALSMSAVTSRLCADSKEVHYDEAYVSGLLADLGVLFFVQDDEQYTATYDGQSHASQLIEAEKEQFGFDHAALGARVMQRWDFPESLSNAVAEHHGETEALGDLVTALRCAELMSDALWAPKSPALAEAQRFLEREYDYDLDDFITLAVDCKEMISQSEETFAIRLPTEIDPQAILEEASRYYAQESAGASVQFVGPGSAVETALPIEETSP